MAVLGHEQMRTTPRTYSHVMRALGGMRWTGWAAPWGTASAPAATTAAPRTTQAVPPKGNGLIGGAELRGLEPLPPGRPSSARSPRFPGGRCSGLGCAFTTLTDRGGLVRTTAESLQLQPDLHPAAARASAAARRRRELVGAVAVVVRV